MRGRHAKSIKEGLRNELRVGYGRSEVLYSRILFLLDAQFIDFITQSLN